MAKEIYSLIIGFLKSLKNVVITVGSAAMSHLYLTYQQWVPSKYIWIADFIVALIAYMIKNKIQFEKRNN